MIDFLNNILSFPTLFFTGLLALVLFYWLSSLLGIADLDIDTGELDISEATASSGFLTRFKLDGIPITVSISVIVLLSWIFSFLLVHYYQDKLLENWLRIFIGAWVIILTPILSTLLSGIILSPLKPVFNRMKHEAEGQKADSLVGQTATVRTNKVTMNFGDADIDSGGASLILKIRATEPNTYKRGDRIMLTEYDPRENTYKVRPLS